MARRLAISSRTFVKIGCTAYTYLSMTISTKTKSTALSYLLIITNKTVEMIAMKIFRFLEVATLQTDTKKLVDF